MVTNIHPLAFVHPEANIGKNVEIGPFCVVGPKVTLKEGVTLFSHVVIEGRTTIGPHSKIYPFSTLGLAPQHLRYKGEDTLLEVGACTTIREHVTIHRGTVDDRGITRIGSSCLLMVGSHIAHDCVIGDHVILANQTTLAGHVVLEDHVYTGGLSAILQFVRVGRGAMITGFSALTRDLSPYGMSTGSRGFLEGLNIKKMKHLGMEKKEILAVRDLYAFLFYQAEKSFEWRRHHVPSHLLEWPSVREVLSFLEQQGHRPICMPGATSLSPDDQEEYVAKS